MTKPKVLVLTSTFPRWRGDHEPAFVYELSRRLTDDFDIHILAPHAPGSQAAEIMDNLKVTRFRYGSDFMERLAYNGGILPNLKKNPFKLLLVPFFLISQLLSIKNLIKQHKFELIHAHWIIPQGFCAALIKLWCPPNTKTIITSHGGDLFSLKNRVLKACKLWSIKYCDSLAVVSKAMQQEAIRLGVDENKINIAPMGVDLTDTFIPPPNNLQRSGVVFVGRLVEKKGVHHLLNAFEKLYIKCPDEKLIIIGDGTLREALELQVKKAHMEKRVIFTGAIPNQEIPYHLQSAKVAVFPSIETVSGDQEGLGLTIIEALGCGCEVISSNSSAIDDIAEHAEITRVNPEDTDELSKAILVSLEGRQKTSTTTDSITFFDWCQCAERYSELYKTITGGLGSNSHSQEVVTNE